MRPTAGIVLLLLVAAAVNGHAGGGSPARTVVLRHQVLFNQGWEYAASPARTVGELRRSSLVWKPVKLPHTWNAIDAVDLAPGYRRGAGWYRKLVRLPRAEGRVILVFEGVNITCDVFVNGRRAGGHVGGYVGFEVDVSPWLKGERNEIAVRVDNMYDPDVIPSQKSDFFIYGGITRDVWLKTVPMCHIRRLAIATPQVSRQMAETTVDVVLRNTLPIERRGVVTVVLLDRQGREVARSTQEARMRPGDNVLRMPMPRIQKPQLWSPASPALYTARATLKEGGNALDETEARFGYRWFELKDHGPFILNGERLLLRGTHRHEDFAGLGGAIPDSLHRRDIVMIKAMGANFIRLAHYPQDPEVYRACDELGILVWDELPWCRGGMGGEAWKANTRRLLREQITENFNHPSIILWSLGNELYWLPDFPGGDNTDSLRAMVADLNGIAHALDPGRLTAVRKFYEGADIPDVFSPSIWAGWYSGVYNAYEKMITEAREKYPHLIHVEFGADSHTGRHTENPIDGNGMTTKGPWDTAFAAERVKNISLGGDWSESYFVDLIDWHIHVTEGLDWFAGNAQWAFKDFATPLRPENPIPYVNQKGVVDRAGDPKDAYYVLKSYWTEDPPFCRIQSHTWKERSGPPGLPRPVRVYSNCGEVELFLSGVSLGGKRRDARAYPAHGLIWSVPVSEGENRLVAVGRNGGAAVARDSIMVTYRTRKNGPADRLELSVVRLPDGRTLATATVVDRDGLRCLDYNRKVYFAMEGGGYLAAYQGTPTGSPIVEMANGMAQIEFFLGEGEGAMIEARTMEFRGTFLVLKGSLGGERR